MGSAEPTRAKGKAKTAAVAAAPEAPSASTPSTSAPSTTAPRLPVSQAPLSILHPDGSVDRALEPELSTAELRRIYLAMLQVRVLDERMLGLQRQGRIGFYGACSGQEAAVIGSGAALSPQDWVFPALREGGVMLLRGYALRPYLGQIFGNVLDPTKGRQMPSHMSERGVNQVSWSSCIGSQIPQAVGAAWAAKLRGETTVAVGYMGDGATSSADFHHGMNFAAVFKAPVILFCQNNGWSISIPTKEQTASATIAQKAIAYGMPGHRVDGNDVLAVYAVTRAAVERARRGAGPAFIEAVTYRLGAHSSSDDPTRYRDENEVAHWRTLDPLIRFGRYVAEKGAVSAAEQEDKRGELDTLVREALADVEAAALPAHASLFDDVYAELPWHLRAQRDEALAPR